MQDPLSGTKAAADFITEMMQTREGEHTEVEKAEGGSGKALSQDGEQLYGQCMGGFADAGIDGENPAKVCRAYAQDFDRRHPGGFNEVLGSSSQDEEPTVQKTVSAAGMSAGLGSPSAEVHLTDVDQRKKRRLGLNA